MVIHGSGLVEGVAEASQFDGLGDGSNSHLDATSFNLLSACKQTLPDTLSKDLNDEESCWWIHILKVWIDTCWKEVEPMCPIVLLVLSIAATTPDWMSALTAST